MDIYLRDLNPIYWFIFFTEKQIVKVECFNKRRDSTTKIYANIKTHHPTRSSSSSTILPPSPPTFLKTILTLFLILEGKVFQYVVLLKFCRHYFLSHPSYVIIPSQYRIGIV